MPRACIFFSDEVFRFFQTGLHIALRGVVVFPPQFYRAKILDQSLSHTKTGLWGINAFCSLPE